MKEKSFDAEPSDAPSPQEAVVDEGRDERAERMLGFIESHTARMIEETRQAIALLVSGALPSGSGLQGEASHQGPPTSEITIGSLERHAPAWAELVPDDAISRAAIARLLSRKYRFACEEVPNIRQALQLDGEMVRQAYEAAYGRPLTEMYVTSEASAHSRTPAARTATVDDPVLHDIEDELTWVSMKKGETLMREGDEGDAMYIVASGRLRAVLSEGPGNELTISEIGRGESVGEMAIVTGEPRSATVYAVRDSELIRLSRAGFDRLVENHPRVLLPIIRILAQRVRRSSPTRRSGASVTTIAVLPAGPGVPLDTFTRRLTAALSRFGPTLQLDRQLIERYQAEGAAPEAGSGMDSASLVAWLNDQESRYRYVVYAADPGPSPWTRRCLRQADRILVLGMADSEPSADIRDELRDEQGGIDRELVLLHADSTPHPVGTRRWLDRWRVTRHHHVRLGREDDLRRLARSLVGRAVGLVLSGGGARAFGHIGVIRALQEAEIPVDWVGASSAGAVVAGEYGMGWDWETMLRRSRALVEDRHSLLDYTFPLVSVLAAKRLARGLNDLFGDARIEDLWLGYFCTSSSLASASLIIHRSGLLRRAIRASCALPGIVPPLLEDGELLVDGGILDNMPVDAMKVLCGGGPVIAVDVSMEFSLEKDYHFGEGVSAGQLLWNRVNPFARSRLIVPNIVITLLRTAELQAVRSRSTQRARADLYIQPPVAHFGTFDTKSIDSMIQIGYHHAREQIAAWKTTAEANWAS